MSSLETLQVTWILFRQNWELVKIVTHFRPIVFSVLESYIIHKKCPSQNNIHALDFRHVYTIRRGWKTIAAWKKMHVYITNKGINSSQIQVFNLTGHNSLMSSLMNLQIFMIILQRLNYPRWFCFTYSSVREKK